MKTLLSKFRALFRRRDLEAEMAEEIRQHLERRIQEKITDGMAPDEARYAAQREFGGVAQVQEQCRDERRFAWLEDFGQDVRHGFRMLRHNAGFAFAAVLTLALGIGGNTAIFSVLNAVLLRPPPFREADRLVTIWSVSAERNIARGRVSPADFIDWQAQSRAFEQIALTNPGSPITVLFNGVAERASCQYASPELFPVLGVAPLLGGVFAAEELHTDANVVLLSEGYWRRRFAGDPRIAGTAISFNGEMHTVVGVVPRRCRVFNDTEPDIWRPLVIPTNASRRDTSRWLTAVARLKTDASLAEARADLQTIASRLSLEHPASNSGWTVNVVSLHEALYGGMRPWLYPLFGAVVVVLLIACTNLANLLLARGAARRKEMAIRSALGGGRLRLFRQLLAEGLALALPGAALGLLFASWGLNGIVGLLPSWLPRIDEIGIDRAVLGFTLLISIVAAVVAAIAPAWQNSRSDSIDALRSAGVGYSSRRQRRTRSMLVVGEVALALVLLSSAGLLLNSLLRLQRVELGFQPEENLALEISLSGTKYWENAPGGLVRIHPATTQFFQQAIERIASLPRVQSAGMISWLPTGEQRGRRLRTFRFEGQPAPAGGERFDAGYNAVSADYFRAMGIAVRQGRGISERDTEAAPWVVVVNTAFARRYWPEENPIGKRLTLDIAAEERPREVVGVVDDVRQVAPSVEPIPEMYVAFSQQPPLYPGDAYQGRIHMSIVVQTTAPASQIIETIRARLSELDPNQPIHGVRKVEHVVAQSIAPWRLYACLLGSFAALAAVLAALGIHAVIAGSVAERRHEIGIRMALGARRGDVLALVFRQTMSLVAIGVVTGLIGSQLATQSIRGWLFGISAHDPLTYGLVCAGIALLAVLAALRPARQATAVDPVVALRGE